MEGEAAALSEESRSSEPGVQRGLRALQKDSLDFCKALGDAFRNRFELNERLRFRGAPRPYADSGRAF